ncbi:type IV conjugative transfer system coupling protein TraD [Arsenophonus nasoniae]|uniref:Type IV conjugative transfer system coupling protein TraD n=1 Tax=Arsenophonus nasoniae TaxID=638 RepID=A0AA95GVM2_9GAMM|nr:type IV conjugative transfer system coupling protein TraD [Arsenophonus nasoniae]WGM03689.1 type IV conjugative transfer system coupling protein TraD [Arsenophonus nasoniae]
MSFNAKDMTQGGQIAFMRLRMFGQISNIIFYCLFISFWIIAALSMTIQLTWQTFVNGMVYWWCKTLVPMYSLFRSEPVYHLDYYGQKLHYTPSQILMDRYTVYCGEKVLNTFIISGIIAIVVCVVGLFVAWWVLGHHGKKQSEDEQTGGRALSENPSAVARQLKRAGEASDIKFGKLPIIKGSEIQNFGLVGTVGVGKSTYIRCLLTIIQKRGDMVILYDRSCDYVKDYFNPQKDKILNPLDARCAAWDLWSECLTTPDFDNIAHTLIPIGHSEDPFWQGSARTIFAEAAYRMRKDDDRSYAKLLHTLLSIELSHLREYLRDSPSANLVEEKIEKTAISIRSVLTNYVKAMRYMQGIEKNGDTFTIRDWMRGVQEKGHNSWLFITSDAANHASLKPVISMWLSIAIRSLLAMGENRERRVWIIADELPTLHKLPDLVEILPEARKFGGCFVLGFQSYAQLQDIYGNKGALTLFDVLNTRFFFRATTKEMAEFAAGEIGEREIQKASEQYSYGADPVRDGVSVGKDMQRVQLVSYSDIQSLPDLTCFITLPGPYPVVKMTLKYHPYPKVAPNFIARNVNLDMDKRLANVIAARENERINMDKLFIPVTSGNNQEDTQTTATETAGMTQQKEQMPAIKIQHTESSVTTEPQDEKTEKSQINGKINRHHPQRKEEVNINRPSVEQDIGDTL